MPQAHARRRNGSSLAAGAAVAVAALFAGTAALRQVDPATTERLGGPTRYLTHVSTDKPVYKLGETVYARAVVLDARTRVPAPNGLVGQVLIRGPKGETVLTAMSPVQDGAIGFAWKVPDGQAGGEYTLAISGTFGHAPGERKFDVRVYRAPRLKSQIQFARDGYGAGDTLTATLETMRAEGGVPKGARITAVARVDGADVATAPCALDDKGRCTVSLKLPALIERGEGVLAFTIEDGGVVETATKTIPLLVQSFDVSVYPEGGDLVAGLKSRVYLEARTLAKKPADIAGEVVDSKGAVVGAFRTEHEGRGRFELLPKRGERYTLRVTEPSSVKKTVELPLVADEGASLRAQSEVVPASQPARLVVGWTGDRLVKVTLRQRDVELDALTLDARKQAGMPVSLNAKDAEGVLVATVWTKDGEPLAERLLFRESKRRLTIELTADRQRYVPGADVRLTVRTLVDGKPAPAVVGLTVTDDSVQELIEKREQAPTLPVMVYLESDVRELADAHVYLDPKHPKAKLAVDLLLGTQGWRRFAIVNVADFLARAGDAGRRALAVAPPSYVAPTTISGPPPPLPGGNRLMGMPRPRSASQGVARPQGNAPEQDGAPLAMARPAPMAPMGAPVPPPPGAPPRPPSPAAPAAAARAERAAPMAERDLASQDDVGIKKDAPAERNAKRERADDEDVAAGRPAQPSVVAEVAAEPFPEDMREVKRLRRSRPLPLVTVREYAHQVRPDRQPNDRLDFAETLYWAAAVRTDAQGTATLTFGTSDAVTSFRAAAGGYTDTGTLGAAEVKLDSVKPFYVEPKLPLEVTEGDVVRLPVAFVNGTREPLAGVSLTLSSKADLRLAAPAAFALKADERVRRVIDLTVSPRTRSTALVLDARAGPYTDVVTRELSVKPKGFPALQSSGGLLEAGGRAAWRLTMPPDTVPGSVETSIAVYPSPAGNLASALKSMIREPCGCFEQTSSTTYPMTMALQYFQTHTGADPAVVRDAQEKLERGYKRLVGYECKEKGFEWFGQDPGHEALTAYGILQFNDMQKVRAVDAQLLANTRAWLLKQRDGKGGFERKRRALHTWIEDKDASDAYITWALLEAGETGLTAEVDRVKRAGLASSNSYVVALAANVAHLAGDAATADALRKRLAERQAESGMVQGGTQSIVGSTGQSLAIETTALATLAWLRATAVAKAQGPWAQIEKAMKGLQEASKDGSYGATQSTVLALRAVLEYDRQRAADRKPGAVRLLVDGKPVGAPLKYNGKSQEALPFADVSELMGPGTHTLELVQEAGGRLPWSMAVRSHRVQPESSSEARVALSVELSKPTLAEGDVVEATARVSNLGDAPLPTVVAIVGVPGGLEPRIDHLKELVKAKTVDAYEVMGRDVVLYWRSLAAKQQVRVPVSLVAAVPGTYVGPASRAYPYYGAEHKAWVAGLSAVIAPKP